MLGKHCKEFYFYKLRYSRNGVEGDIEQFYENTGYRMTMKEALTLRKYFSLAMIDSKDYDLPFMKGYQIFMEYCRGVM